MKVKTCKSLSGRSTLSYVVEGDMLRIVGNSSGGVFSPDAVSLDAIKGHPTAQSLQGLFKGKSLNNAGFALAAYYDHQRWVDEAA